MTMWKGDAPLTKKFPIFFGFSAADGEAQCLDANNFLVITHKSESLNLGKWTLKMILVSVSHTKNTQEKILNIF
jgi:hypothetical protein